MYVYMYICVYVSIMYVYMYVCMPGGSGRWNSRDEVRLTAGLIGVVKD